MCTGTTPACGNTCGRGAGTHGDVLNVHTGAFCTYTWREGWRREEGEGVSVTHQHQHTHTHQQHTTHKTQGVIASSAHQNLPTLGYRLTPEVHQRTPWILQVFSLRIDREQHVPDYSNHSLHLINLSNSSSSSGTLRRESATRWFDLSFATKNPSFTNDLHVRHFP